MPLRSHAENHSCNSQSREEVQVEDPEEVSKDSSGSDFIIHLMIIKASGRSSAHG